MPCLPLRAPMRATSVFAFGLFAFGLALELTAQPLVTERSESNLAGQVHGGTGIGVFQDVQVPVNEDAGLRGDGRLPSEENSDHIGFPLYAGIGMSTEGSAWRSEAVFDVLQMRATSGPAETQSSSYSRFNLGGGVDYVARLGRYMLVPGGRLMLRRSSFNNISSSHYIDALMVQAGLGLATHDWKLEASAAMAPEARFYFSSGATFGGGKAFKTGKTNLIELSVASSFALSRAVSLDLGLAQEQAHVTIGDISEYDDFGLQVSPSRQQGRDYRLATTVARVGFTKSF